MMSTEVQNQKHISQGAVEEGDVQHNEDKEESDGAPVLISVWLEGGTLKETFKVYPPVLCENCRRKIIIEDNEAGATDSGQFSPLISKEDERKGFLQSLYSKLPSFGSSSEVDESSKPLDTDSGIFNPEDEKNNESNITDSDNLDPKESEAKKEPDSNQGEDTGKKSFALNLLSNVKLPEFRFRKQVQHEGGIEEPVPEPQYVETQESFPDLSEILGNDEGEVIVPMSECNVESQPIDLEIPEYDSIHKDDAIETSKNVDSECEPSPKIDLDGYDVSIELPEKVQIDEDVVEPAQVKDKSFEIENLASEHKNYIVYVKTGNAFASGTNSIVYLSMYGDKGESEKLLLEKLSSSSDTKVPFQRNQLDIFYVTTFNVGDVNKIRVAIDPKGWFSGWNLQNVLVYDQVEDKQWNFKANQWLDGKRQPEIELLPLDHKDDDPDTASEIPNSGVNNRIPKEKEEMKDSESNSETPKDAKERDVDTQGGLGTSDVLDGNQKKDQGTEEKKSRFRFGLPSLPSLPKFASKENNVNDSEKPALDVKTEDSVHSIPDLETSHSVTTEDNNEIPVIPLEENHDESVSMTFDVVQEKDLLLTSSLKVIREGHESFKSPSTIARRHTVQLDDDDLAKKKTESDQPNFNMAPKKLMYKIMVRTGKKALEESDVNVYIYLVGQKRETDRHVLPVSRNISFKSQSTDTFFVEEFEMGELQKIRIGCDNLFSSWSLENVTIEAAAVNSKWIFPISQELTRENCQCDVDMPSPSVDDDDNTAKEVKGFKLRLPEISWPNFRGKNTIKGSVNDTDQDDHDNETGRNKIESKSSALDEENPSVGDADNKIHTGDFQDDVEQLAEVNDLHLESSDKIPTKTTPEKKGYIFGLKLPSFGRTTNLGEDLAVASEKADKDVDNNDSKVEGEVIVPVEESNVESALPDPFPDGTEEDVIVPTDSDGVESASLDVDDNRGTNSQELNPEEADVKVPEGKKSSSFGLKLPKFSLPTFRRTNADDTTPSEFQTTDQEDGNTKIENTNPENVENKDDKKLKSECSDKDKDLQATKESDDNDPEIVVNTDVDQQKSGGFRFGIKLPTWKDRNEDVQEELDTVKNPTIENNGEHSSPDLNNVDIESPKKDSKVSSSMFSFKLPTFSRRSKEPAENADTETPVLEEPLIAPETNAEIESEPESPIDSGDVIEEERPNRGFGFPFKLSKFRSNTKETEQTPDNPAETLEEEPVQQQQQQQQQQEENQETPDSPAKRSIFGFGLKMPELRSIPYIGKRLQPDAGTENGAEMVEESSSKSIAYQIAVYTSDLDSAGTNADIFVSLIGEHGEVSEEICLTETKQSRRNIFNRGSVDVFIRNFQDVGHVKVARIVFKGNDENKVIDSWHLDKIILTRLFEYDEAHSTVSPNILFEGDCWFGANAEDGILVRELQAETFDLFKIKSLKKVTIETNPNDKQATQSILKGEIESERVDQDNCFSGSDVKAQSTEDVDVQLNRSSTSDGSSTTTVQEQVIYIEETIEELCNPDGTKTTTMTRRNLSPSEVM